MKHSYISTIAVFLFFSCQSGSDSKANSSDTAAIASDTLSLKPGESKNKFSHVIGWPTGKMPVAPEGFTVKKYAGELENPRYIYEGPNGDIFVVQSGTKPKPVDRAKAEVTGKAKSQNYGSANSIAIFRDTDKDGLPDVKELFLTGLNQPFGMLIIGSSFYVANTDGLMMYPYTPGQTKITAQGKKIMELPAGGYNNHWTRNIIGSADGSKIYVSVGSGSNNGENGMEHEVRRANILVVNADGSNEKIYASGLRNPVGMDWNPNSKALWTAVNERDKMGDELVPDYITSVKEGGFYGWPYAYWGKNEHPDFAGKFPEYVNKTIVPDMGLGAHTASLGLAFYDKTQFPAKYQGGAFVGQHGSWNHSELVGYKVLFVPFKNGMPSGKAEDFLSGFIADKEKSEVFGRPVGVTVTTDGAILVADDASNTVWRVSASK